MAPPLSFRISAETLSGPIDLFLPMIDNFLLMILVPIVKDSHEYVFVRFCV
jgi:hypothetical protein